MEFCPQNGRPHGDLPSWMVACPFCAFQLHTNARPRVIDSQSSSSHPMIIDLSDENQAMPSAPQRFPSLSSTASTVESHRQQSIAKAQKARERLPNAGSSTLSSTINSQPKSNKTIPVPERVKITIVAGTIHDAKSFKTIGTVKSLRHRNTV